MVAGADSEAVVTKATVYLLLILPGFFVQCISYSRKKE